MATGGLQWSPHFMAYLGAIFFANMGGGGCRNCFDSVGHKYDNSYFWGLNTVLFEIITILAEIITK